MMINPSNPVVAIACGGTGGHLFPGVAVADCLIDAGFRPILLTSQKEIDQQACRSAPHVEALPLPGAGWTAGSRWGAVKGAWHSYRQSKTVFRSRMVRCVLAMGGFSSIGPVLAARSLGSPVILHEANRVPGRATRWLSPFADTILTGFKQTSELLHHDDIRHSGMPVRRSLGKLDAIRSRMSLGLDPDRPVLLVMGGSQGARPINELFLAALPELIARWPELQFIHLTGVADLERARSAVREVQARIVTLPFAVEMDVILAAASLAVSRSGASSIAEFAVCRIPSILIPYPIAADDHQTRNAESFVEHGAATMLRQMDARPIDLVREVLALRDPEFGRRRLESLEKWNSGDAALNVARVVITACRKDSLQPDAQAEQMSGGRVMEQGEAL